MPKATHSHLKYTDHQRKEIIRTHWCLPQIRRLSETVGRKLIYAGLTGIDAFDIKDWIDYFYKVIAFQCSNYKEKGREVKLDVSALDAILEDFERQDKLSASVVYQGYMEDILMGALDERGQTYLQDDFIKVYNLDFCDNIDTPRETKNEAGKLVYYHKFEAIERLLNYQSIAADQGAGSRFLMYLTVNSNVFKGNVNNLKSPIFKQYHKTLKTFRRAQARDLRLLKAYCFYNLKSIFQSAFFNVEFLPPIYYLGSDYPNQHGGNKAQHHNMMTFTILGTRINGGNFFQQDEETFLNSKFMFADNRKMSCFDDRFIEVEEINYDPDSLNQLTQSYTYQNLW